MTVESYAASYRPYILAGCAILLLAVIAAALFVVRIFITTSKTVDDTRIGAEGFLAALEQKDFALAHSLLAPEGQAANSEEKLEALMQTLEKKHGKALRHSPNPSFHFSEDNKQVSLSYWERWEKTETTVLMDLSRQRDGWRVKRFDFLERSP